MGRRDWPPRARGRRRPFRRVDHHPASVHLAIGSGAAGRCTRRRLVGLVPKPSPACAGGRPCRRPSMAPLVVALRMLLLLLLLPLPSMLPLPLLIPWPLPGARPGAATRGVWVASGAVVALR